MLQNIQRGMVRDDERLFQRQIVELLANPRIGPISVAAIAANLGVSPDRIIGALDALIRGGRLVRVLSDAYTAPPVVDGLPLRPHPDLAPAATPLYVPEALHGDWLLVGDAENAKDAKEREVREEGRQKGTAEDAEDAEGAEDVEEARKRTGSGVDGAGGAAASAADGGHA